MLDKIHTAKEQTLASLKEKNAEAFANRNETAFRKLTVQITELEKELSQLEIQMYGEE